MRVCLNLRDLLVVGVSGATSLICVSQAMATPLPSESQDSHFPDHFLNGTGLQYKTFQAKTFEPAAPTVKIQKQFSTQAVVDLSVDSSDVNLLKPFKQTSPDVSQSSMYGALHPVTPQLDKPFTIKVWDQPFATGISPLIESPSGNLPQLLSQLSSQSSLISDGIAPSKRYPSQKNWAVSLRSQPFSPSAFSLNPLSSDRELPSNLASKIGLGGTATATDIPQFEPFGMPVLSIGIDNRSILTHAAPLQENLLAVGWAATGIVPPINSLPQSVVETPFLVSSPPIQLAQIPVEEPSVDIPDLTPPSEPYPQAAPDGTLQTNPPAITQPSADPLYRPNAPEQVEIQETVPITLEQAIDLARRNSPQVKQFALQVEQRLAAVRQQQAALFPTLSFTSSLARNESANTTLSSRAQNRNLRNERRKGNVTALATPFAVPFGQTTFNNTLQLIYDFDIDGSRSANIRANEEQLRAAELNLEEAVEDLRSNVTESYYDLQQADANVDIQRSSVRNAQKSLEDAEALERAGVGTRFEVLQARVTLSRNQQNLTNAISQQRTSRRALATVINVSQNANLITADPIELAGAWDFTLDETIILAYQNRAELEEQLRNRDVAQQQRRAALAANRPQLTASANYNVLGLITDDPDPFATRGWADGYSVQLQLQWNFFDGGAAKALARQREIDIALAEENFSQLRNQIRFEVEQAFYELQANFENIGVANLGVEEATEALRLARLRFQAGVGTQTDVINQETALTLAQNQLLQAIIGYNRSLSQLWRAVSNLPGGNLQDQP